MLARPDLIVGTELTDDKVPAWLQHARRLCQHFFRVGGMVKHHVRDDRVGMTITFYQHVGAALNE